MPSPFFSLVLLRSLEVEEWSYLQASDTLDTGGRLSQKFGADLSNTDQKKFSGDADLPSKLPLADRRAKVDNVSSRPQKCIIQDVFSCAVRNLQPSTCT